MKTQMLLTADYASVDQATGKLNVLGAFNRIHAKKFPAVHPRMTLVVKLVASEATETTEPRSVDIILTDDDGNELLQVSGTVILPIDNKGFRKDASIVMELNTLEFPHAGAYEFGVWAEGKKLGETTIELIQI